MQATVFSLFCAALAVGLAELLLPEGSSKGTALLFRFLCSLVILLLILAPFRTFLQKSEALLQGGIQMEESKLTDYEQIFEEAVQSQSEADFKKGLLLLLQTEYGIKKEDVTLLIRFDADGTLSRVCIFLSGAALLQNPDTLARNLNQRLGCAVEVR